PPLRTAYSNIVDTSLTASTTIISCYFGDRQHLHSFPTRRSSDLHTTLNALIGTKVPTSPLCFIHIIIQGLLQGAKDLLVGLIYLDRKSTRLNSSHVKISYAVFCLKKKKYSNKNNSYHHYCLIIID